MHRFPLSPEARQKLGKAARGLAIAAAGAAVTYGAEFVATGGLTALGPWGPLAAVLASAAINAGREYLKRNPA